jgi:hypothetical protein
MGVKETRNTPRPGCTSGRLRGAALSFSQLGCDFALSSRIVVGGVADVSSSEVGDQIFPDPTGTTSFQIRTDHHEFGTVRGRIGYTFENVPLLGNTLLYGTGGWAWADSSITRTQLVGITGLAVPPRPEAIDSCSTMKAE